MVTYIRIFLCITSLLLACGGDPQRKPDTTYEGIPKAAGDPEPGYSGNPESNSKSDTGSNENTTNTNTSNTKTALKKYETTTGGHITIPKVTIYEELDWTMVKGMGSDGNKAYVFIKRTIASIGARYEIAEINRTSNNELKIVCSFIDDGNFSRGLAVDNTYFYTHKKGNRLNYRRFNKSDCSEGQNLITNVEGTNDYMQFFINNGRLFATRSGTYNDISSSHIRIFDISNPGYPGTYIGEGHIGTKKQHFPQTPIGLLEELDHRRISGI